MYWIFDGIFCATYLSIHFLAKFQAVSNDNVGISSGELVQKTEYFYDMLVEICYKKYDGSAACGSGTAIGPNVVLTARHIIIDTKTQTRVRGWIAYSPDINADIGALKRFGDPLFSKLMPLSYEDVREVLDIATITGFGQSESMY